MEIKKHTLIFLLISIGLITLPHIENLPLSLFAFFGLLWCWRFVGIWKPNWLPNNLVIFLLTVSGIILLNSHHIGVWGRNAGTALFVTALGLKLLEIKSPRDIYLINYLAFIVAASQFLFQQSILMAVYTLFVCCVLLATLISINSQNPQTISSLKISAVIIAQALPIAVAIFILFPRIDAPRWMLLEDKHQAKSGLSDSLEPGSISNMAMSDELAFRVKFQGEIPPPRMRYWRGPVFSYTNGKRWSQGARRFFDQYMDETEFSGKAYQYTLLMEAQKHNWVYALDMPAQYSKPLQRNNRYQLITRNDPDERAEYQVTSYPQYNTGDITKTEYRDNLQLPGTPSEKITALVKKLKGFDQPPEVFIKQLLAHFRKENFHYTLMPPLMENNPIETFLFETRYGFCGHYATAFAYLMRVANIPARVVGGYQGGEVNQVGGFLEVRQANAHAWAEVWLEDKGWVRFDPTASIAPERVEQDVNIDLQIASGAVNFTPVNVSINQMNWLKQGRQLWDSMDYSWQRWVINYNNANQSKFFESLGIRDLKTIVYWLFVSIASISAILACVVLKNNGKKTDPAVQLYRQFCARLAKQAGIPIKTGEGAHSYARRVKRQHPELAVPIDKITNLFIKIRYQADAEKDDLPAFKQQVRKFKIPAG